MKSHPRSVLGPRCSILHAREPVFGPLTPNFSHVACTRTLLLLYVHGCTRLHDHLKPREMVRPTTLFGSCPPGRAEL